MSYLAAYIIPKYWGLRIGFLDFLQSVSGMGAMPMQRNANDANDTIANHVIRQTVLLS